MDAVTKFFNGCFERTSGHVVQLLTGAVLFRQRGNS
jgi:hypothetical protein